MINLFSLILAIITTITGILWCCRFFILISTRRRLSQKHNNNILLKIASNVHKSTWIETSTSIFPILLLVFIVRSFIIEPFQIPSGSMMPTLLVGDFILVEKFSYGIKNPITQKTLIETGHPKRGDVVVFKYPLDPSLDYIKRVVGLPGDWIRYDFINKRITVQSNCIYGKNCTTMLPITYSEFSPSDFVQTFYTTSTGQINSYFLQVIKDSQIKINDGIRLFQRKEYLGDVVNTVLTLPGKQDHLSVYYRQPGSSIAEWIVPQGEYFMMGDNRDNSADSRYWGFVPERNLVGKAVAIWMSFDKQQGQWPTGLRLNRIGSIH